MYASFKVVKLWCLQSLLHYRFFLEFSKGASSLLYTVHMYIAMPLSKLTVKEYLVYAYLCMTCK